MIFAFMILNQLQIILFRSLGSIEEDLKISSFILLILEMVKFTPKIHQILIRDLL